MATEINRHLEHGASAALALNKQLTLTQPEDSKYSKFDNQLILEKPETEVKEASKQVATTGETPT